LTTVEDIDNFNKYARWVLAIGCWQKQLFLVPKDLNSWKGMLRKKEENFTK